MSWNASAIIRFIFTVFILPLHLLAIIIGTYKKNITFITIGLILGSLYWVMLGTLSLLYSGTLSLAMSIVLLFIYLKLYNDIYKEGFVDWIEYVLKVIGLGGGFLFLVSNISALRGLWIYLIALASTIILRIFGLPFYPEGIEYMGNSLWFTTNFNIYEGWTIPEVNVPINGIDVTIVYECSGLRELVLGAFAIMLAKENLQKRFTTLRNYSLLLIIANIIRNALVLYIYNSTKDFFLAHEVIGNGFISIILLTAFLYVFTSLPSVGKSAQSLFLSSSKKKPIHLYLILTSISLFLYSYPLHSQAFTNTGMTSSNTILEVVEPTGPTEPEGPTSPPQVPETNEMTQKYQMFKYIPKEYMQYSYNVKLSLYNNRTFKGLLYTYTNQQRIKYVKNGVMFEKVLRFEEIKYLRVLRWTAKYITNTTEGFMYSFYPIEYQIGLKNGEVLDVVDRLEPFDEFYLLQENGAWSTFYSYFVDYWVYDSKGRFFWKNLKNYNVNYPFFTPLPKTVFEIRFVVEGE